MYKNTKENVILKIILSINIKFISLTFSNIVFEHY